MGSSLAPPNPSAQVRRSASSACRHPAPRHFPLKLMAASRQRRFNCGGRLASCISSCANHLNVGPTSGCVRNTMTPGRQRPHGAAECSRWRLDRPAPARRVGISYPRAIPGGPGSIFDELRLMQSDPKRNDRRSPFRATALPANLPAQPTWSLVSSLLFRLHPRGPHCFPEVFVIHMKSPCRRNRRPPAKVTRQTW